MLRGTESQIFDTAYFLLRRDCEGGAHPADEILREAERIVAGNTTRSRLRFFSRRWVLFSSGVLCGVGLSLLLFLLLR
ncbi:MAG: hypothetical protein IJS44_00810 [Clostridia bacterium]|nr:hypothetical protein [Clostridia bacterium]